MRKIRQGLEETLPYSLSRWTDLPAAKWEWFKAQLAAGSMVAMDPRTGLPDRWSLVPAETLGLVFWTRNPQNLVRDAHLLTAYRKVVHFTLTGWHEVEIAAPGIDQGVELLQAAVDALGCENVRWRFSPVPLVDDVVERFARIATRAAAFGLKEVYLSFLQPNDEVKETRSPLERAALVSTLAKVAPIEPLLCNDDLSTAPCDARRGVCEDGASFAPAIKAENCGCALMVDPFSQNEACVYGCRYCYSANRASSSKKRNTTKLTMLRRADGTSRGVS